MASVVPQGTGQLPWLDPWATRANLVFPRRCGVMVKNRLEEFQERVFYTTTPNQNSRNLAQMQAMYEGLWPALHKRSLLWQVQNLTKMYLPTYGLFDEKSFRENWGPVHIALLKALGLDVEGEDANFPTNEEKDRARSELEALGTHVAEASAGTAPANWQVCWKN